MKSRLLILGVAAAAIVGLAVWSVTGRNSTLRPPNAELQSTVDARRTLPPRETAPAPTQSTATQAPSAAAPRSRTVGSAQPPPLPSAAPPTAGSFRTQSASDDDTAANVFPWPPPAPSTSYQLPNSLFGDAATMGAVAKSIDLALESTGYVERRYYKLPVEGIALVTRLERVNTDGSPAAPRWLTSDAGATNLYLLVRGLFLTDPGHYRVIVFFITKDLPGRKPEDVPIDRAKAWLKGGLDDVPMEAGALPYKNGRTIAYIYDFISDGRKFTLDREPMPGKDQLTKAGVLTALSGGGK